MTIKRKPYLRTDSDGVMALYAWSPARDVLGVDFSTTEGLAPVDRSAPYRALSLRAQDIDLAVAGGYEAERKARVKLTGAIADALAAHDHGLWAYESGRLYRITYADVDATHAFLTMAQIVAAGRCELVTQTVELDENLVERPQEQSVAVYVRDSGPARAAEALEGNQTGLTDTATITVRTVDWGHQPVVIWPARPAGGAQADDRGRWNVVGASSAGDWTTLSLAQEQRARWGT